ncbi:hypothetical protein MXD61_05135, partial [Frankia sp. AgPm24]|nr:hypothetical protein [Frankia sp. AgPm24]
MRSAGSCLDGHLTPEVRSTRQVSRRTAFRRLGHERADVLDCRSRDLPLGVPLETRPVGMGVWRVFVPRPREV